MFSSAVRVLHIAFQLRALLSFGAMIEGAIRGCMADKLLAGSKEFIYSTVRVPYKQVSQT